MDEIALLENRQAVIMEALGENPGKEIVDALLEELAEIANRLQQINGSLSDWHEAKREAEIYAIPF